AKIQDDHAPSLGHEHVRGVEVAVELAGLVERPDAPRELEQRRPEARLIEAGDRIAHVLEEARSLDVLHGEKPGVLPGDELVERAEVRVDDALGLAELFLEAVEKRGAHLLERLQRDPLAALAVDRLVDEAHPSGADEADDVIRANRGPLGPL